MSTVTTQDPFQPLSYSELADAINECMSLDRNLTKHEARSLAYFLCEDVPTESYGTSIHLSMIALRDDRPMSASELDSFHRDLDQMLANVSFARSVGAADTDDVILVGLMHDYVLELVNSDPTGASSFDLIEDEVSDAEFEAFIRELFGAEDDESPEDDIEDVSWISSFDDDQDWSGEDYPA